MIVLEFTEDKFGKAMKAVSKITEHAECLADMFEELADSSYGNRKSYDEEDRYDSRYNMRRKRY